MLSVWISQCIVGDRMLLVVAVAPDKAAVGHFQWFKYPLVHNVVEVFASDVFDDLGQVDIAFARIAEAFARREMNGQQLAATPVRKPRRVAEYVPRSDPSKTCVVADVVFTRQVF